MEAKTLQVMQEVELGLAKEYIRVCNELGLTYFLAYGSMLGAVRHSGFIPWDDDMDFIMPRPDYEMFLAKAANLLAPWAKLRTLAEEKYIHSFAKLDDARTVLAESVNRGSGYRGGIYIDIFPIDGLPEGDKAAKEHVKKCTALFRNAALSYANMDYRADYPAWKKLASRILRLRNGKKYLLKLDRALKEVSYGSAKQVFVCGEPQIFERKIFEDFADYGFEGAAMRSVSDYENYLSMQYGDYMTLPPPEMRRTEHAFDELSVERGYEDERV